MINRFARHSPFETNDPDLASQQMHRILHRRIEIAPHHGFHLSMVTITLQVIAVTVLEFTGGMRISSQADGALYMLMRLESGTVERHEAGRSISITPGSGILVPPHASAMSQIAGEKIGATLIGIPTSLIQLGATRLLGYLPKEPMELLEIANMSPLSYVGQKIEWMLTELDHEPNMFTALEWSLNAVEYQHELVRLLIERLPNSYQPLLAKRVGNAAQWHVGRLEEFLQANLYRAIKVPAMAAAIGVSDRTLREACKAERGQTPEEVFVSMRLHEAHRRFEAPGLEDTVGSIAHELHFSNVGRMAEEYRKIFQDEQPSVTLARGKKRRRMLAAGGK
jgi:AraC-like DNA-binding protein